MVLIIGSVLISITNVSTAAFATGDYEILGDYTTTDSQIHTTASKSLTINKTSSEATQGVIPKEEQDNLFREYQSTGELLYQTQTLNGQLGALIMAAIFLLLGLSISNLSKTTRKSFEYYFPFIVLISVAAFTVWAAWFIYMSGIQKLLIDHKIELEEKLGFDIQRRITEKSDSEIIPQTMPIFGTFPITRNYWSLLLAIPLTMFLSGLYFAVVRCTHLLFYIFLGITIAAMGFLLGLSGVSLVIWISMGLIVPIVSFLLARRRKKRKQQKQKSK